MLIAYLGQRSLSYYPDAADPGAIADWDANGRDVSLRTDDGLDLDAWLVEPTGDDFATTLAVSDPAAGVLLRDRFDTLGRIGEVRAPTAVLAGGADEVIDPEQSATVAEAVVDLHEFVMVPDADHNDARWFGGFMAEHVAELVRVAVPDSGT